MLYRCYCFNYTCMFFFRWVSLINFLLSFIPILSVLQSQRDIHEHIGGGFFLLSLSALNMWSCQQHRFYLWYLVRDFFFLDLDDKIVSAPLITHRYRDLGRAPYRTGRSQQVSSPFLFWWNMVNLILLFVIPVLSSESLHT